MTHFVNIGFGAFRYCLKLVNIVIPDGVTSIGGHVFSQCSSIENVTIPASVTSIGKDLFLSDEQFASCPTIHTTKSSYAEKYAAENDIEVVLE